MMDKSPPSLIWTRHVDAAAVEIVNNHEETAPVIKGKHIFREKYCWLHLKCDFTR